MTASIRHTGVQPTMMKRHFVYLWMILIPAVTPGRTAEGPEEDRILLADVRHFFQRLRGAENMQEGSGHDRVVEEVPKTAAKEAPPSSPDLPRLRQEVQRLKERYRTEYIKAGSDDYALFESIGTAARHAPELIDSLIGLCDVKEVPSTTEKYSAQSLTPASFELQKLGIMALPQVVSALADKNLGVWRRAVLEEVHYFLARDEATAKGLPPPPEYQPRYLSRSDFDYVTAKNAEILMGNPPPEWLLYGPRPSSSDSIVQPQLPPSPPQRQAQPSSPAKLKPVIQTSPQTGTTGESSFPFAWRLAVGIAAALLLFMAWQPLKKRK